MLLSYKQCSTFLTTSLGQTTKVDHSPECVFYQVWELRNTKEQKENEDQDAAAGDAAIMSVAWSRCEHVLKSGLAHNHMCLHGKSKTYVSLCARERLQGLAIPRNWKQRRK
eukprot:COSAG06_NODE_25940_length_625_cov_1.357414_1_plen_110_part_01